MAETSSCPNNVPKSVGFLVFLVAVIVCPSRRQKSFLSPRQRASLCEERVKWKHFEMTLFFVRAKPKKWGLFWTKLHII